MDATIVTPTPARGGWTAAFTKYLAVARTAAANRWMYLGDALSRPLFFTVILFVFVQLWRRLFAASGGPVAGFDARHTLWYLVITEGIMLSAPRIDDRIDQEVKSGTLAVLLGRPCNYITYHVAWCLGEALPMMVMNLAVGSGVACLLIGAPPPGWGAWPVLLVTVAGAFVLHALLAMNIGLLAFWVEDTAPFFWIYHKLLFIAGGLMFPVQLYPDWLRGVLDFLPFRAILNGPASSFVHFSPTTVAHLLAWQWGWIAVASLLVGGIFRVAVRRVDIQGG